MYLGWYDPDKKKSPSAKLNEALDRHVEKYGIAALVALVNPSDAATITQPPLGVELRPAPHVAPNTFFVGEDTP